MKAPFFLSTPSTTDAAGDGVNSKSMEDQKSAQLSRIASVQLAKPANTRFTSLLRAGSVSGDYNSFFAEMKSLTPARLELEIRSLGQQARENQSELSAFVLALSDRLASRVDFELVNAWMTTFLRIHSDVVAACSGQVDDSGFKLKASLRRWTRVQQSEIDRLSSLVGYCRGVIGFLKSSR